MVSRPVEIALQLWTVRRSAERDMLATLRAVAALGYRAVEFAGLGSASAADVRRALDNCGLAATSAHVPLSALVERLPAVVEQLAVLGCHQVVVPWIPPANRVSLDSAKRLAEAWNELGTRLAAEDIAFAYHNEDYDFAPLEGTTLWHALVRHTDPAAVALQLDICTATLMRADPLALLRGYGARITSLHVCDLRADAYVPIGTGELDWHAILEAARQTATRWLIVEQDDAERELDDAATSLRYLQGRIEPE